MNNFKIRFVCIIFNDNLKKYKAYNKKVNS